MAEGTGSVGHPHSPPADAVPPYLGAIGAFVLIIGAALFMRLCAVAVGRGDKSE